MRRTCFYHAGCPDGFGAAWAAWRAWGEDGRYVARGHDDPLDPTRHDGELVVFADIAVDNELLRELADFAERVVVLDHHASAEQRFRADPDLGDTLAAAGHLIHFDRSHSGAVLAWQHFHPQAPPPELLRYVEDQDLWSWRLPHSEEVNAAIGSHPREFEAWDKLAALPTETLAAEGAPIVRSQRIEVERALTGAHGVQLGHERIEAVNARHLRARIGHALAERAAHGRPWGLVYRLQADRVDASVYSIGDVDVAEVAARYGGGGHRNAAGFSVSLRRWLEEFLEEPNP